MTRAYLLEQRSALWVKLQKVLDPRESAYLLGKLDQIASELAALAQERE